MHVVGHPRHDISTLKNNKTEIKKVKLLTLDF